MCKLSIFMFLGCYVLGCFSPCSVLSAKYSISICRVKKNLTKKKMRIVENCKIFVSTQCIERANVLPHVLGLLWMGLKHDGVHVIPETEAGHLRWVYNYCKQILAAAQIHLHSKTQKGRGVKILTC